ncbi:MAG: hypothetical protein GY795_03530 [Desulfobacterales bacterium]|nr:hypothetical protein [Desulfobacterales bacterium]
MTYKDRVQIKAIAIRNSLKQNKDDGDNPINIKLKPVDPFIGNNKINLVIIGQDPTIRNFKQRSKIKKTLNLDRKGAIRTYIETICKGLNISIENVYATNLFKYFYTYPPAKTPHVLESHSEENIALLIEELSFLSSQPIVTLGEPVLKLISMEFKDMKFYWDYQKNKPNKSGLNYKICPKTNSRLNTLFYPFPHQPSMGKTFYKNNLNGYIEFLKQHSRIKL